MLRGPERAEIARNEPEAARRTGSDLRGDPGRTCSNRPSLAIGRSRRGDSPRRRSVPAPGSHVRPGRRREKGGEASRRRHRSPHPAILARSSLGGPAERRASRRGRYGQATVTDAPLTLGGRHAHAGFGRSQTVEHKQGAERDAGDRRAPDSEGEYALRPKRTDDELDHRPGGDAADKPHPETGRTP